MDESDPGLTFDESGVCNKCHQRDKVAKGYAGKSLDAVLKYIKYVNLKEYDSVIGLSGGADSSYVYHLAKNHGLRPYVIHFDNGWDTAIATDNIHRLTEKWGDELHIIKANLNPIHLAFFMAGLPDIEVPTDHAIRACLYDAAEKVGTNHVLSGMNYATESHASGFWTHGHRDWRYIESVCNRMKVEPEMPHYSIWRDLMMTSNLTWVTPLNYIEYNRAKAINEMTQFYRWESYGGKHQESVITRFVHGYIIPRRFGYDTRRSRLSAMICSNQLTREEALRILSKTAYPEWLMKEDRQEVEHRWGISSSTFDAIMDSDKHHFRDFPSYASNPVYLPARAMVKVMQNRLAARVMR
jgi:hypothetical protein